MTADYIWIHFSRPRPPWYALSGEERGSLTGTWSKIGTTFEAAGAERLGRYRVRGQSDFSTVDAWRFTDPDQCFAYWSELTAAGYSEWFTSSNAFGAPDE